MSNTANIDLRQASNTIIEIDKDTTGVVTWSDIPTLDSGYTITLDGNVYTVGSGIVLDGPSSSIAWTIDSSLYEIGEYEGDLVSDSKVVGTYFKTKITLKVQ